MRDVPTAWEARQTGGACESRSQGVGLRPHMVDVLSW